MSNGRYWIRSLAAIIVAGSFQQAVAETAKPEIPASDFYKSPALFSMRATDKPLDKGILVQSIDRFGAVGIGIELHLPAFWMKVKNVEAGSPAAAAGELKAGQIIETINGQKLKDIDPRIQLGAIVTAAEATDGKVIFEVRDTKESPIRKVTVAIPVLGAYSETWPLDCAKSDRIVSRLADLVGAGKGKLGGQETLFLLSTGEEKDLNVVRGWVKEAMANFKPEAPKSVYQWRVGWDDPAVAEYYLRTGDKSVLPYLKQQADAVRLTMYHDGWGGRGMAEHHMGIAGTSTLTFILLARQCGVEVDENMLQRALQHYYRFAGRGVNPYMDDRPEGTFTDNGRVAKLAFAMAAASALIPDGEKSVYAGARDISALKSFYSTSYMLHGHTGGGIGEVWRSAAMGLMYEKKPEHYREFMKQRTWFYDLSRRYDGSFGILGGGERYDSTMWGLTLGLTYTAPRKKLCIFGAPLSKYAKKHDIAARPWGTAADDAFYSLETPVRNGQSRDLSGETVAEDTGVAVDRKMAAAELADDEILKYIYHPEHRFREVAAGAIHRTGKYHLIPDLLKDKDPRIRNAGIMAIVAPRTKRGVTTPGIPEDKLTPEIKARLLEMLNDPDESWYTVDKILERASLFSVDELKPHMARLDQLMGHEEWWLRHSALAAMFPLARDKSTYKEAWTSIGKNLPDFIRCSWPLWSFAQTLTDADPEVQKTARETLGRVYLAYPGKNANPPGGLHPASEAWYMDTLSRSIVSIPGGLGTLFEVASKRYPERKLPHSDLFLPKATSDEVTEGMGKALRDAINNELIPMHIQGNWVALNSFAQGKSGNGSEMDKLVELHSQAGVSNYNWLAAGPKQEEVGWYYHSFDPKEEWVGSDDRLGRYRDVTFPAGMEKWFATDFDPKAAGWKQGVAPFGSADGQKGYIGEINGICPVSHCRCGEPINTLWEKDVILLHGTFKMPVFEDGYCYRLVYGGTSHVGSGGGYSLYVNGKPFAESKQGVDRRAGSPVLGRVITKELWPEFSGRDVTLAAISFMKHHPRTKKYGGNITFFLQRMKVPPLGSGEVLASARLISMLASEWQDLNDPEITPDNPEEGKFRWDGKFAPSVGAVGVWTQLGDVASIEAFKPGEPLKAQSTLPKTLQVKDDGSTDAELLYHTGGRLMDLTRNQALKMTAKNIDGNTYLFVEAGGFSDKHGAGWKCPLVVFGKK